MKTRQEIFNIVLTALREQGKRAADGGTCSYINQAGDKCGIGHLLSNEMAEKWRVKYVGSLVGALASPSATPFVRDDLLSAGLDPEDKEFLQSLQDAHDATGDNFLEDFERYMERLSTKYALEYKS